MSAASVIRAMDPEKYEVVPIGITKDGRWITTGDPLRALTEGLVKAGGRPVALLPDPSSQGLVPLAARAPVPRDGPVEPVDVIFPVLHGPYGEDGTVQGLLELANVPYVGAGVLASAAGMDKAIMKALFRQAGLPVVRHRVVLRRDWETRPDRVVSEIGEDPGFPCFVKPCNLGSSVGISKVRGPGELGPALDLAARYDRKLLVEEAVPRAREIEVSVLGNDEPVASVPGEIVPSREFYDYRAKYLDGTSELIIPAPLPDALAEEVRSLAVRAFQAIDAGGMARVDFLLDGSSGRLFVSEINTIPGFTKISMYPKLWEASGLSYGQLIDRLIELAIERHRDKQRNLTTYEPDA